MTTQHTRPTGPGGGGCLAGLVIMIALGALIGLLLLEHGGPGGSGGRGTGHDPMSIDLPRTVEQKRALHRSEGFDDEPVSTFANIAGSGLHDIREGVYGDAPGSPTIWVVEVADNDDGKVGPWLAANAPSGDDVTTTAPRLRIAGTASCSHDRRDGRSMCTWYDENLFVLVTGPATPEAVQDVLLRVYDGTEH
ncbi:hypothetical protein GCM10009665_38500 [Kitasatospora nipponensis]|uniref:DUF4245 domain-containing protein n=1 Tax=Kitasatospora nipponensis TaxID=258049 RepID=A0ABN1WC33_9ACTN